MLAAALITLREGLEAALIVGIVLLVITHILAIPQIRRSWQPFECQIWGF
ncbi:MAG: hypothetical protein SXV54_21620 [Chloroflexota bacterium]|nr:hypothetical protein [Chloroflexota bacterium]